MTQHTCTYDPADDKLRMSPSGRLPADEYSQIKAAGFSWAPKQEVFYAVWTPAREILMIEWCGEIDDEDTTLVDRAAVRADRFEDYSDKRTGDAERAHQGVAAITDGIPFGQPILVGHHSEKRARKDADRIQSGMERAVKMWDTAAYWTSRAAGAVAHAKYLERSDVRQRRIKGLEADLRKRTKTQTEADTWLKRWNHPGLSLEQAQSLANYCHLGVLKRDDGMYWSAYDVLRPDEDRYKACPSMTVEQVVEAANRAYPRVWSYSQHWIDHINNRLLYERAMLAEAGGTAADKFDFAVGGQVKSRGKFYIITKINRQGGAVNSVSVLGHFASTIPVHEIFDYIPPKDGDAAKVLAATKKAPACNYPGEIALMSRWSPDPRPALQTQEMTKAQWALIYKDNKGLTNVQATDVTARHQVRFIIRGGTWQPIFLTDQKRTDPPAAVAVVPVELPVREHVFSEPRPERVLPDTSKADAVREQLKNGIQVVSAPQLFPTPVDLAARMVEMAEVEPGMAVLEPSAGTGRLIDAILAECADVSLVAYEINRPLADRLQVAYPMLSILDTDFLECGENLDTWDRIIMNPPFVNGADIKHIKHAFGMLRPGGRLVAICAGGPRQEAALKPLSDSWEPLPSGTFEESGTGVNTVLLTMVCPELPQIELFQEAA